MIQLFNVIELLVATDEEMPSPLPLTTSHCWQGKSRIHPPCLSRTRPGGSSWPKTVVSPPAAAGLQCTAGGHRTIGDAHREPALPRRTMLLDDGPCPPVLGKGHSPGGDGRSSPLDLQLLQAGWDELAYKFTQVGSAGFWNQYAP